MEPAFHLVPISGVDARPAPLNDEAFHEGFGFVARLMEDWTTGSNTFSQAGERLIGAVREGRLLGVCGLNRDPYVTESGVGRLRHLYVKKAERHRGISSALVRHLVEQARGTFRIVRLRAGTPQAAAFYEAMGFTGTADDNASHVLELN